MARILIADIDRALLEGASAELAKAGHDVSVCESCEAAREAAADTEPEAAVIDFNVGGNSAGVNLAQELRAADPSRAIVLMSSIDLDGWDRSLDGAERLFGVDALVDKPVTPEVLAEIVEHVLDATTERRRHVVASPQFAAILSRGIANERLSEKFYRMAAEKARQPEVRQVLLELADDEQGHARLLEDVRSGKKELPPPKEDHATGLLEAMAGPSPSGRQSPKDAFRMAIEKEKAAVEFYKSWASIFGAGPERDLLERLAEMEEGHRERLERLYLQTAYPEAW